MQNIIDNKIAAVLPEIKEFRHQLHQIPEIAGKEFKTSAKIRELLSKIKNLGIQVPFLETDTVAMLHGKNPGKNVTLRADIDALPLQELNSMPYKSQTPGMMHGCGHDGHCAMVAGAALVLSELCNKFNGSIRFVFQPGEEVAAMGKQLLESGALENPEPDAVFALHGMPEFPVGHIISRSGTIMAAASMFTLQIKGRGGHGSKPELAIDPIVTGSQIVNALQTVVSRKIPPHEAAVVSVCRFTGGTNCNVIPDSVTLEGTTRFLNKETGNIVREELQRVIDGICKASGADYVFDYKVPYIPTVNRPEYIAFSKKICAEYLGDDHWHNLENSSMGGEDFSFYLDKYPGSFCFIGMGEDHAHLHNPHFDFNDDALANGIKFLCALALEKLKA